MSSDKPRVKVIVPVSETPRHGCLLAAVIFLLVATIAVGIYIRWYRAELRKMAKALQGIRLPF